ncbi:MAG: glycosyltransferase family 2 protein [Nitrospirota bacterium]|nr:glycosyltransferase family 2 protein [Nitrospirota bacterium]
MSITLSIVIPVYNGEQTIGHLCSVLIDLYTKHYKLDIVLVNDGSRDGSDLICKKLHADYPDQISYIKLSKNFGEHNAVLAGLNHVNGDYCVIMDDDFQNPPEEVGKLVEEIKKGYDVVYAYYASKKDSWFRNFGSKVHNKMANVILKKPGDLYLSSFKIVNRFLMKEIIKYIGPDPYLDAIILRSTDNIGKVQLLHRKRTYSESGYTLAKLVALWGNMIVSFSLVPLRIIGFVGAAISVIGLFYGLYKVFDDLSTKRLLTDYESLMFANMVFRGMVLLAISLLGEYVGRIYLSLNKDPQFVIRDKQLAGEDKRDQIKYLKDYQA